MKLLSNLRDWLGWRFPALTDDQHDGVTCVHCGHRFEDGDATEPVGRDGTMHRCARCLIETADGLTGTLTARIDPRRHAGLDLRHYPTLTAEDARTLPAAMVTIADEKRSARSALVRLDHAHLIAACAGRLGFDAEILEHRGEKEDGR